MMSRGPDELFHSDGEIWTMLTTLLGAAYVLLMQNYSPYSIDNMKSIKANYGESSDQSMNEVEAMPDDPLS